MPSPIALPTASLSPSANGRPLRAACSSHDVTSSLTSLSTRHTSIPSSMSRARHRASTNLSVPIHHCITHNSTAMKNKIHTPYKLLYRAVWSMRDWLQQYALDATAKTRRSRPYRDAVYYGSISTALRLRLVPCYAWSRPFRDVPPDTNNTTL